jgi:hypothetical protein
MISTPVQQHRMPRVLSVKFLRTSAANCERALMFSEGGACEGGGRASGGRPRRFVARGTGQNQKKPNVRGAPHSRTRVKIQESASRGRVAATRACRGGRKATPVGIRGGSRRGDRGTIESDPRDSAREKRRGRDVLARRTARPPAGRVLLAVRARRTMRRVQGRRQKDRERQSHSEHGRVPHGPAGSALGSHEVVPYRRREPSGRLRGDACRRKPGVRAQTACAARRVRGALLSNALVPLWRDSIGIR